MELKVLNTAGKQVGTVELNDAVFAVEYNEALIHQVVVAQLANKRQGTKSTLTRTEVRGGGVKPYRQKGTGRARQGSIRSPQFVKGGVVFAPKPRDFRQKLNKFSKRQALLSALSQKIRQDEFIVVDEFKVKEAKTKEVANILKALELNKKTLLVVAEDNKDLLRASRNIADLQVINADLINVYDVVRSNKCVVTKAAAEKIEEANL
ncbi:MAG: 50S ribosomal protein L4 [Eubacteriales bacterium]|jgi:large subunit ribosomal protein L4|nr:50S ribosomal protein L4 [Faecalibacterium sp.]MDY6150952.1 50S ribosomal protein L4 [Eubacteriales bacterium]CCY04875.1 50S ribosomal protein L4 [Faecalibacterium sp. CAG:1138]